MKTIFALALTCAALWCTAQTHDTAFRFKTALSFNPTVLAATDATIMFGAEHRLPHRLALVLDAGYIFDSYYFQNDAYKGVSGFAVRPGLKRYNHRQKGFLQFQVAYKQVDYKMEDWLGKGCVNGVHAYEKFQEFTYRKKALSFNALAGQLFRISDGVLVELYTGFGIKIKDQRPIEKNACYRNFSDFDPGFTTLRTHDVTANIPLGVKLLVAIKR